MARRVGFDEVRISAVLAARQKPQEQWTYRADGRIGTTARALPGASPEAWGFKRPPIWTR